MTGKGRMRDGKGEKKVRHSNPLFSPFMSPSPPSLHFQVGKAEAGILSRKGGSIWDGASGGLGVGLNFATWHVMCKPLQYLVVDGDGLPSECSNDIFACQVYQSVLFLKWLSAPPDVALFCFALFQGEHAREGHCRIRWQPWHGALSETGSKM